MNQRALGVTGCRTRNNNLVVEAVRVETLDDPRITDFRHIPDPVRLRERGTFVAEGRLAVRRLIADARFRVRALLVTPSALRSLTDAHGLDTDDPPVYVASRALIKEIGGYDFHQGCLGLADRPQPESLAALLGRLGARQPIVILEQVGNADNVGGIFRNAAAFGAAAVLLSPGCCDPLYRKAVRTSIAASLRIPFAVIDDWPDGLDLVRRRGYDLVALTPDADATSLSCYRFFEGGRYAALMLGNEGDGLSPHAMAAADGRVRIPLEPTVDSLNVATTAAILLHHIRRLNQPGERLDI